MIYSSEDENLMEKLSQEGSTDYMNYLLYRKRRKKEAAHHTYDDDYNCYEEEERNRDDW